MATVTRERPQLEPARGMYMAQDAALYVRATLPDETPLNLPTSKMLWWIRTGVTGDSYHGIPGREMLIDFEDLISMRVISALRAAGVSWPKIRKGEDWLKANTSFRKPFATLHIWSGQGEIFTEWSKRLIAASKHGQLAFDILHDYIIPIHGLKFEDDDAVAKWWEPQREIRLNPTIQFGAPCLAETRIPTRAIVGALKGGDSREFLMDAYEISLQQLEAAIEWESRLQSSA